MLETRGTLLVPCKLEATATVLEIGVETGFTTDKDADREEEAGSSVEDPATAVALEDARTTADELAAISLDELVGVTR